VEQTLRQHGACSHFLARSPGNSITDPVVSASSWIVQRQSSWMSSQIFLTFSVILLVLGCPECWSSSTDIQPAWKHECQSETAVQLKECSLKASRSISGVLIVDLPSFTQNLMQTRCSILASHRRQNETRSRKSTCIKSMHVTTITVRELSDKHSYNKICNTDCKYSNPDCNTSLEAFTQRIDKSIYNRNVMLCF
jgi:hypothetical protein